MKTLLEILVSSFPKTFINCWLEYTLSQPVEIDLNILLIFTLQYFGFTRLKVMATHLYGSALLYLNKLTPLKDYPEELMLELDKS